MIGKFIKTMRKIANKTQTELANECNISNTTLSGYETGYREPSFKTLNLIAEKCGFEIRFVDKGNEELTIKNIDRKEL